MSIGCYDSDLTSPAHMIGYQYVRITHPEHAPRSTRCPAATAIFFSRSSKRRTRPKPEAGPGSVGCRRPPTEGLPRQVHGQVDGSPRRSNSSDGRSREVTTIVVWRLDRLDNRETFHLFDELYRRKINLVSIKDSLDLSTAAASRSWPTCWLPSASCGPMRGERVGRADTSQGKDLGGGKAGRRVKERHHSADDRRQSEDRGRGQGRFDRQFI